MRDYPEYIIEESQKKRVIRQSVTECHEKQCPLLTSRNRWRTQPSAPPMKGDIMMASRLNRNHARLFWRHDR